MSLSLSIIIPSFNRPDETARAVACACAEAPQDCEILLVDDGSSPPLTDLSGDPRVRLLRHSTNRGAAAARNTGLNAARGDWVAFLDSDDTWPSGAFATRWVSARADANASPLTVFVCGFRHVDARTGRTRARYPVSSTDPIWFASGCWFCPGSTALFRRAHVLDAVGLQDEALPRLEDLDWFLRLALAGGGIHSEPICGAEITRSAPAPFDAVAHTRTAMLRKYAAPPHPLPARLRSRLRAYLNLECAASAWGAGRIPRALAYMARSWLAAPRLRLHLQRFWTGAGPRKTA